MKNKILLYDLCGKNNIRFSPPCWNVKLCLIHNNIDFDSLPENAQHTLVDMCFNLGANRLGKFRNMLYACSVSDWNEMARQMEDSRWYGQVGRRSKFLQEQILELA